MSHHHLSHLRKLATLMDRAFTLPGTKIQFGWDSILGIVPGLGDTAGLAVSGYIVAMARQLGAPGWMVGVMVWNIFIDWLIGLVPFLGDIFDVGWKANLRNIDLLEKHLQKRPPVEGEVIEGKIIRP